jgi:hypothetical protein
MKTTLIRLCFMDDLSLQSQPDQLTNEGLHTPTALQTVKFEKPSTRRRHGAPAR